MSATRSCAALLSLCLAAIVSCDRSQPPQSGPVEIRIIGEAYTPLQALASMKDRYEKDHNVRIAVEQYEFETALEKVTLDASAKTGRYDIILQPHLALGRLVESGHLEPIRPYLDDPKLHNPAFAPDKQIFEKFWKELSWYDGTLYGYPFTANTMYLWYRKDLLDDADHQRRFRAKYGYDLRVPDDWKQYRDVAEYFTDRDRGFFGTALQAKRHPALWYEWLNFAYSFGGGVFEKQHAWETGPIIVDCPETIEATQYYHDLKPFCPPGTTEFTWDDVLAMMQQGKVFMVIMWSDATAALEDPKQSTVAGKMGYAMVPEGKAGRVAQIAGWSYLISKHSKHKADAYRFIEWMMLPENQIRQQLLGGASAVRQTYGDPDVQKLPFTKAYVDSLEAATSMSESIPQATQISEILQVGLSDIMNDRKGSKEGLRWCAEELQRLLKEKVSRKCP